MSDRHHLKREHLVLSSAAHMLRGEILVADPPGDSSVGGTVNLRQGSGHENRRSEYLEIDNSTN